MRFGLTPKQEALLTALFDKHLEQGRVIVYGSRAAGNFSARSDLDLVLDAAGTTDRHSLAELKDDIMESDFPYLCDLFYLDEIANPALLEHIKKDGKILYEKQG